MAESKPTTLDKEHWRNHLLCEIVGFLEQNKEEILDRYEVSEGRRLSEHEIKVNHLMDFDVTVTLHCDRRSSFGLGAGFFKANLIR